MNSFQCKRLSDIMGIIRYRNKKHNEGTVYNYSSDEVVKMFEMYFDTESQKPVTKNYSYKKFNIISIQLLVLIILMIVMMCIILQNNI